MMKVLVTGSHGYIGRYAIPYLLDLGYEVHALSRTSKKLPIDHANLTYHTSDLFNPSQMADLLSSIRVSHLLHLAWYTKPGLFWHAKENLDWVAASLQLVRQFTEMGGERLVVAGTCAEYDWTHEVCHENNTPLANTTLYSTAKNCFHKLMVKFSENNDLSMAWGRIFYPFGPYEPESRLVPKMIMSLLQGTTMDCSAKTFTRDFIYVGSLAKAFVDLLDSDYQGSMNIASGKPMTFYELAKAISTRTGNLEVINFGGYQNSVQDPEILLPNTYLLKEILKFSEPISFSDGLDITITWWQDHIKR